MTILCGTDFSPAANAACEVAALIAAANRERLVLVHAAAVVTGAASHDDGTGPAEKALRDLASRLAGGSIEVSTSVKVGAPDEVLLAEIEKEDAQLVILGSVGQHGLKLLLGSTSDSIAARSRVPLMVLRGDFPVASWLRDRKPLRVALAADLGPSTSDAARWTSQLTERGPCEFMAMHVSWPPEEYERLAIEAPMHLDRTHPLVEQVIRGELSSVASRLKGSADTKLVVETNVGSTGAAIAQLASAEGVDLLVVGRGRDEGRSWWQRSVSRSVVRQAPMSVVCVPEVAQETIPAAPPIRKVLCATDFSPLGNSAVAYATSFLTDGGDLMVVHVLDEHPSQEERARARQQLETLVNDGRQNITLDVLSGHDPARLISAAAERFGADLICVGSRGRAPLAKAMLGSVSQGILLSTKRPVLMVPAPL